MTINIPTLTATWVDGDPTESFRAEASWDLLLDLPAPACLGFIAGTSPREGANLLAVIDLHQDDYQYHWWICGLADSLRDDKQGCCTTLEEAQAEVSRRLGGV